MAVSSGAILGKIWKDDNKDGTFNGSESILAGIPVRLWLEGVKEPVRTALTSADGKYAFAALSPGVYRVTTGSDLANQTSSASVSMKGTEVKTVDLGWVMPVTTPVDPATASLSGMVFKDANNNGVREAGDTGIAQVGVELRDAAGNLVATTTTDASGAYKFNNLKAGNYVVDFVEQSAALKGLTLVAAKQGGDISKDSDVTNASWNATGVIALGMGEAKGNIDAGYAPPQIVPATVSGTVWNDANQDGIRNGSETGIAGVVVQLRDMSIPNGVNGDWKANIVAEVKTDASGNYSFTNVAPGKYQIDLVEYGADGSAKFLSSGGEANVLKGLTLTSANAGSNDAVDSDITDRSNQMTDAFVVKSGDKIVNLDAGYFNPVPVDPATASLSGMVFKDANNNGVREAGDAGIAAVGVELRDAAGVLVKTMMTDADGKYSFTGLKAGSYVVDFVEASAPLGGLKLVAADQGGNDAVDSDATNTGWNATGVIALAMGEAKVNIDAGYAPPQIVPSTVSGTVWNDANQDGIRNGNETGIAGVVVQLRDMSIPNGVNGDWKANIVAEVKTDASGNYTFTNVAPGKYQIDLVEYGADGSAKFLSTGGEANALKGLTLTSANAGGNDAVDSDITDRSNQMTDAFVVKSGDKIVNLDAGYFNPTPPAPPAPVTTASIMGQVWLDNDRSKAWTHGDAIKSGVAVDLYKANPDGSPNVAAGKVASAVTDAVGTYNFNNLAAGKYVVDFNEGQLPAGYKFFNAASSSIAVGKEVAGWSQVVDLAQGQEVKWLSAGASMPAEPVAVSQSVSGHVWHDINSQGLRDGGEPPISGVRVDLRMTSNDTVVATATTDDKGYYIFKNISAGQYYVDFDEHCAAIRGSTFSASFQGDDPARYSSVVDSIGITPDFFVTAGADITELNAGVQRVDPNSSGLSGQVWIDADRNNTWTDGVDKGVNNVRVDLYKAQSDGSRNMGAGIVATTTTSGAGNYQFNNLPAGKYVVDFDVAQLPAGHKFVFGPSSSMDEVDLGLTKVVTLGMNEFKQGVTGQVQAEGSIVSGRVWTDYNADGVQDTGDFGIANVAVALRDASTGASVASLMTDGTGRYSFNNVAPGTYYVDFDENSAALAGKSFSRAYQGDYRTMDSDVTKPATGQTDSFTITTGTNKTFVDAAMYPSGSVSGMVWVDQDGSGGSWTAPDWVIKTGVKVDLYLAKADGTPDFKGGHVDTTTTDANGNYKFSHLKAGVSYVVDFDETQLPKGLKFVNSQGVIAAGTNDGWTKPFTLAAGENKQYWDGETTTTQSIYGWMKNTYTGKVLTNAIVVIYNTAGAEVDRTIVDRDGYFEARVPAAGNYKVFYQTLGTAWQGNWLLDNGSASGSTNDGIQRWVTVVAGGRTEASQTAVSPIAIDLDGSGAIETTALAAAGAETKFDLLGTGDKVRSGWLAKGDGFLVIDTNHNGKIDNINEMFGGAIGAGFAKLAKYDTNGDGIINIDDGENFLQLKVWQDANGDRITDPAELKTLADVGIVSLKVSYEIDPSTDGTGNLVIEKSTAVMVDGREVLLADVYFHVDTSDLSAANLAALAQQAQDSATHVATLSAEDQAKIADVIEQAANDVLGSPDAPQVAVDTHEVVGDDAAVAHAVAVPHGGILADVLNIALDHLREAQPDSKALNVLEGLAKGAQNLNLADLLPGEGSGQVNLGALLDTVHGGKHADGAKGSEKANAKAHSEAWMQEAVSALGEGHAQTVLSELAKLSNTLKNHGHHD